MWEKKGLVEGLELYIISQYPQASSLQFLKLLRTKLLFCAKSNALHMSQTEKDKFLLGI